MIKIESLTLQRGPLRLLENASLTLHAGQKVGLLGTNGAGKSSLFALLLGQLTPDAGDCSLPPDWRIAHMRQEIDDLQRLAVDYVLDGDQRLRQIQRQLAEALPGEHDLDDHDAGEQVGELDAGDGHDRHQRVAQHVAADDHPAGEALGPGRAGVVLPERLERAGPDEPGEDGARHRADDHGGQHEVPRPLDRVLGQPDVAARGQPAQRQREDEDGHDSQKSGMLMPAWLTNVAT